MSPSAPDTRRYSLDLAKILADLHRADNRVDDLLEIGQRLSRLGTEVAAACETAHVSAQAETAA